MNANDTDTITCGSMTMTREQARRAGLLPEQRRERARRSLDVLRRYDADKTVEGAQLMAALRKVRDA
jgi:hypothetical protein